MDISPLTRPIIWPVSNPIGRVDLIRSDPVQTILVILFGLIHAMRERAFEHNQTPPNFQLQLTIWLTTRSANHLSSSTQLVYLKELVALIWTMQSRRLNMAWMMMGLSIGWWATLGEVGYIRMQRKAFVA